MGGVTSRCWQDAMFSKSAKTYDNFGIRSTKSHMHVSPPPPPNPPIAKRETLFLAFLVLIASFCDMFNASTAGCSRFPVA